MYRRDYIIRMIEEARVALESLLGLYAEQKPDEAIRALELAARGFLHEDWQHILSLAPDDLPALLRYVEGWDRRKIETLAMLLYGHCIVTPLTKTEGLPLLHRALRLFEWIDTTDELYSLERKKYINDLLKRLNEAS